MPVQQIADDLGVLARPFTANSGEMAMGSDAMTLKQPIGAPASASRIPRKIPPDFIDTFVYHPMVNGHAPNIIANTMAPPGPALSTRWLYKLIDRTHRNGDTELSALPRRKYKKNHP